MAKMTCIWGSLHKTAILPYLVRLPNKPTQTEHTPEQISRAPRECQHQSTRRRETKGNEGGNRSTFVSSDASWYPAGGHFRDADECFDTDERKEMDRQLRQKDDNGRFAEDQDLAYQPDAHHAMQHGGVAFAKAAHLLLEFRPFLQPPGSTSAE